MTKELKDLLTDIVQEEGITKNILDLKVEIEENEIDEEELYDFVDKYLMVKRRFLNMDLVQETFIQIYDVMEEKYLKTIKSDSHTGNSRCFSQCEKYLRGELTSEFGRYVGRDNELRVFLKIFKCKCIPEMSNWRFPGFNQPFFGGTINHPVVAPVPQVAVGIMPAPPQVAVWPPANPPAVDATIRRALLHNLDVADQWAEANPNGVGSPGMQNFLYPFRPN